MAPRQFGKCHIFLKLSAIIYHSSGDFGNLRYSGARNRKIASQTSGMNLETVDLSIRKCFDKKLRDSPPAITLKNI